jgi:hypothetical protein
MQGEKLNNVYPIAMEGKLPYFKAQWREPKQCLFKRNGMEAVIF